MSSRSSGSLLGCLALLLLFNLLAGGICTEYVVEFWASYFKGVPVHVPFWTCALAGLFIGEITAPLAIVTWIFSFVM